MKRDVSLRRQRDLYRRQARKWNREADRYLAQRDALTVELERVRRDRDVLLAGWIALLGRRRA